MLCVAALSAGLVGCRGERTNEPPRQFIPDMDDGPRFKPQSETEFFSDRRTMRPRVAGTVAFGESTRADAVERARYNKSSAEIFQGVDPSLPKDKDGAPGYVRYMPPGVLDMTIAMQADLGKTVERPQAFSTLVERGRERFNIYCSACHGYNAEGGDPKNFAGGVVGRRWGYPVPSLHDPKYIDRELKTGRDGYIFNVIQHGVPDIDPTKPPKMPSYADKIREPDAWAIVAYVRVLQSSWQEDLSKVPSEMREKLERSRPVLPAATPPPSTPAAVPAAQTSERKVEVAK